MILCSALEVVRETWISTYNSDAYRQAIIDPIASGVVEGTGTLSYQGTGDPVRIHLDYYF